MIVKHATGSSNLRVRIFAFAALSLLAQSVTPARSAEFVLKFGTATQNETQHQFIKFYKEALEAASHGRIEVQVYPNSQLGPIPREIEGVQLGTIQGYIGPVDFFVGVEPRYGVFSAPMLFRDEANVAATIHDPELQQIILTMAEPKRLVGLATLAIGAADYAAKRPLLRLTDFEGKKLRINGTELERAKMSRLGASGIAMPLSEVLPALSQGAIDGTISGLSVFVAFKMNDLVKVITVINHTRPGRTGRDISQPIFFSGGPVHDAPRRRFRFGRVGACDVDRCGSDPGRVRGDFRRGGAVVLSAARPWSGSGAPGG